MAVQQRSLGQSKETQTELPTGEKCSSPCWTIHSRNKSWWASPCNPHRPPTTITFLSESNYFSNNFFKRLGRKAYQAKLKLNISFTWGRLFLGTLNTLQKSPLTLRAWLYSDRNSFKMEKTSLSPVFSSGLRSFSFVSLSWLTPCSWSFLLGETQVELSHILIFS